MEVLPERIHNWDIMVKLDLEEALPRLRSNEATLTKLDLDRKGIGDGGARTIADALKANATLSELRLGGNGIGVEGARAIADALKTNATLSKLSLVGNKIGVEGARAIAGALKANAALSELNLDWNRIYNEGAREIADALKANVTLSELHLGNNRIHDEGARAIADALKANATLSKLHLRGNSAPDEARNHEGVRICIWSNSIYEEGAHEIADALKVNATLSELDLGYNSIGAEGACKIADALKANATLVKLDLGGNELGDEGAREIADALEANVTLSKLDLEKNNIGVEGAREIADALKANGTLSELDLRYNSINVEGARAIADALKANVTLLELGLGGNDIGFEGTRAIADALKTNANFSKLSLVDNKIGVEGAREITDALKANAPLSELHLGHNDIGDEGARKIADALKANATLSELDLTWNRIGVEGARAIADALKANTTLLELELVGNGIGDKGACKIADALKANSTLSELDLGYNKIGVEGAREIADALKVNTTLVKLVLGGNGIGDEGTRFEQAAQDMISRNVVFAHCKGFIENHPSFVETHSLIKTGQLDLIKEAHRGLYDRIHSHANTLLEQELQRAREKHRCVPLMRSRITVVGRGRDGKTCTINSLKGLPFDYTSESTAGIAMDDVDVQDVGGRFSTAVGDTASSGTNPWSSVEKDDLETKRAFALSLLKTDDSSAIDQSKDQEAAEVSKEVDASKSEAPQTIEASELDAQEATGPSELKESKSVHHNEPRHRKETAGEASEPKPKYAPVEEDAAKKHAEFDLKVDNDSIRFSIFDNGGQRVFQSIQRLLLSRNGVYVVVFNLSKLITKGDNQDEDNTPCCQESLEVFQESLEALRYWLSTIKLDACSDEKNAMYPPVVLVGTHFDLIKKEVTCKKRLGQINSLLLEQFGSMGVLQTTEDSLPAEYRCLYNSDQKLCFWPVNNTDPSDKNIQKLRQIIIQAAINDPLHYLDRQIPLSWLEAMDELARLSEEQPVLPLFSNSHDEAETSKACVVSVLKKYSAFYDLQEDNEHYQDDVKARTIAFLKFGFEQGALIYFSNVAGLEDYCILDPQWLLDRMTYIVRDFQLHRFHRDYKAMRIQNGESWTLLLQRGILQKSLLQALWLGEGDHFNFLVNLMLKLGLFGTLHGGSGCEMWYTVPMVVTNPSVESWEMSMPKVLAYLGVDSKGDLSTSSICMESFAIVPFYNRLVNSLVTDWKHSYTPNHHMILPSGCNLLLGKNHPFSLVVDKEAGKINVMATSIAILGVILHHVCDTCKSLNNDAYSGRLDIKWPNPLPGMSVGPDVLRNTNVPLLSRNQYSFQDDAEEDIAELQSFFSDQNPTITRMKARQWAEAIIKSGECSNEIELLALYYDVYECEDNEFKAEVLPEIPKVDQRRISKILKKCPAPKDTEDYFVGHFNGSDISVKKEEKRIRRSLSRSYLNVAVDETRCFVGTFQKLDQFKESKVLHFPTHGARLSYGQDVSKAILKRHGDGDLSSIECVFLNACSSSEIGNDIDPCVKNVVCWDTDVVDEASRSFSETFYHCLGENRNKSRDFGFAFERAQEALELRQWALIDPGDKELLKKMQREKFQPELRAAGIPKLFGPTRHEESQTKHHSTQGPKEKAPSQYIECATGPPATLANVPGSSQEIIMKSSSRRAFASLRFDRVVPAHAEQLRDAMRSRGADLQIVNMKGGGDIHHAVLEGILAADNFIVFGSAKYGEDTGNSCSTYFESVFAQNENKRIILIRMIPFDEEFEFQQGKYLFGINKLELVWMLGEPMPEELPGEVLEAMGLTSHQDD